MYVRVLRLSQVAMIHGHPCSVVVGYQRVRGTSFLHLHNPEDFDLKNYACSYERRFEINMTLRQM